jgi:hypothetical protein
VQVDVDPVEHSGAGHGQAVAVEGDLGSHPGQDLADVVTRLGRVLRPPRDVHAPTRDGGGREELGGIGQVGLDGHVERVDLARLDPPEVGEAVVDVDPGVAEHLDRHLDVRQARDLLAVVVHRQPLVEARTREEQPRDELAGGGRVEDDLATAHAAGAADREGQHGLPVVDHVDPQPPQGSEDRGHRAAARGGVAVEAHRAVGQARHRRHEPHHIAGQAAVDARVALQCRWCHEPVAVVGVLDPDTESAQCVGHEEGVAGAQRQPQSRDVGGQGGDNEETVGQGLRSREDDRGVHRGGGDGCRPIRRVHAEIR